MIGSGESRTILRILGLRRCDLSSVQHSLLIFNPEDAVNKTNFEYFPSAMNPNGCKIKPTVVLDPYNYDGHKYGAHRLINNTDKDGDDKTANWLGRNQDTSYFVYDLGCKNKIITIVIRNSVHSTRFVAHFWVVIQ